MYTINRSNLIYPVLLVFITRNDANENVNPKENLPLSNFNPKKTIDPYMKDI